jgi:hypothetical protein
MANVETTFIRFICFGYNWSFDDVKVYIRIYKLNILEIGLIRRIHRAL